MHQSHPIQTYSDKIHNHTQKSTTPSSLIVPIKSKVLRNLVPVLLKVLIYRSGERDPSSLPEIPGMFFLGTQQGLLLVTSQKTKSGCCCLPHGSSLIPCLMQDSLAKSIEKPSRYTNTHLVTLWSHAPNPESPDLMNGIKSTVVE